MIKCKGVEYGELSNFSPCTIVYKGKTYLNAEAAWQAQKCPSRSDEFTELCGDEAAELSKLVTKRADWEQIKYHELISVLTCKFSQNVELIGLLKGTTDEEIVNDTTGWHDNVWGFCSCVKCKGKEHKNLLGKALMEVRDRLCDLSNWVHVKAWVVSSSKLLNYHADVFFGGGCWSLAMNSVAELINAICLIGGPYGQYAVKMCGECSDDVYNSIRVRGYKAIYIK